MQIILKPNIELIRQRLKKGNDRSPFNAESFCKNWIGPAMKNLLIPKDEENMLTQKLRRGKTKLGSLYVVFMI